MPFLRLSPPPLPESGQKDPNRAKLKNVTLKCVEEFTNLFYLPRQGSIERANRTVQEKLHTWLRDNPGCPWPDGTGLAGPVAQSVERWTPYGGSIRPGFKSPGFEARRAPDVYRASWRVWLRLVAGRSQSKSAIGTGRARLCAYVKLSTLNSAIDPELRDRKVEDRANATSSA